MKLDRGSSIAVYIFQAVFLIFAITAIVGFGLGILGSILVLIFVWWFGLGLFAAQPVGGNFLNERRLANSFIESQHTKGVKLLARCVYFTLYWPIFISKNTYFWSILVVVVVFYALKFFYPQ